MQIMPTHRERVLFLIELLTRIRRFTRMRSIGLTVARWYQRETSGSKPTAQCDGVIPYCRGCLVFSPRFRRCNQTLAVMKLIFLTFLLLVSSIFLFSQH